MSPQHETQRMKRQQALAVGRIDTASTLTDTLISIVNAIRDQGAPEDTFEHLTQALTGLNQTRRALAAASRSLYRHSEERGLIQPDFYDNWALTDEGHKTALDLLKRR